MEGRMTQLELNEILKGESKRQSRYFFPMKPACSCVHDCFGCAWKLIPGGDKKPPCFISRGKVTGDLPS